MRKDTFGDISGMIAQYRRHSVWRRVVRVLGCIVVFCTAYALILPAITMENTPVCGKEAHTHTESCYTQVTAVAKVKPVCTPEGLSIHQHGDGCRDGNGQICCGYADFIAHKHDGRCYDENGRLWCPLSEKEAHTHDESCYEIPEPHVHGKSCYTREKGELICTASTEPLHTHTEACYEPEKKLVCTLTEDEGHKHGEGCQDENGALICTQEETEGHRHTDACYESVLTCTASTEPAHVHTDDCYTWNETLTCTESTDPKEPVLTCEKEEIRLHKHTQETCFETDEKGNTYLVCDQIQILEHVHSDACFETVEEKVDTEGLTCGKTEGEGFHIHSQEAGCWDESGALVCKLEESEGHQHTAMCHGVWELTCGLEEHTHTEECMAYPELTPEEQAQVEEVIAQIDALPSREEVEERLASLKSDGDQDGYDAYLTELRAQANVAFDAYAALTEAQKAQVTNADRLTALEWVRDVSTQENAALTVTNADGSIAAVTPWAPVPSETAEQLKAALRSVDQVYTIRSAEYYQIDSLAAGQATVAYTSGGLSADETGAKVFVYDLGTDGLTAPQSCAVEEPVAPEGGLFKSFSFAVSSGAEGDGHIYAFISASPATLEEMGIYLGKKLEDGHWIAMDGPDEESANVKIDIQLTGNSTALPNHYPFILKVNNGEDYYPDEDAVRRAVGEVNDVQCYKIHWVEEKDDGTYNFNTQMELGNGKDSRIQLEYLKDDAQLKGRKGGRKLRVFSSKSTDGKNLVEISNSVQNVHLMEENYQGFSFNVTEPCPYVFVSEKVEQGYIDALSIKEIIDGTAPFDSSDAPGYDSRDNNQIVRSYDTIQYNLEATFGARQEAVTAETVNMFFELTLRKSAAAARFDTSKMRWLGENYSVEYLNANGDAVMIMAHNGKYYQPITKNGEVVRDQHGFAQADLSREVSLNAALNGSTEKENSYKVASGGVAMQRLVGWTKLHAKEGESILSGTQSFTAAIAVRNADNGEVFAPAFRMWLEGNEENYGPEDKSDDKLLPAQPDSDNIVDIGKEENAKYQVTVSAGTNFNLQLKKNTDMSYKNWFDFSTGKEVAEPDRTELERLANLKENHGKSNPAEFTDNGTSLSTELKAKYADYRYGRITCYGITLQLYNNTDNNPDANRAAKGVKGLSVPVGDISFDLNFRSEAKTQDPDLDISEYTAILWDYNENIPANTSYSYTYRDPGRGMVTTPSDGLGNGGRNLYWDGENRSPYAKGAAPSNFIAYHSGCYYGGDWALVNEQGEKADTLEKLNLVANPSVVTGSGESTTYHFKVRDYDFDFDNQHFPTQDAGNSGEIPGYDTYARCFSAGCVQVLSVFPRVQEVSEAEIFLNTTVSNLHLTTRAGQELKAQENDATKFEHEVKKDDNIKRDQIVLYAPGKLTKGSAFNGKPKNDVRPNHTSEGFLGTDYWTTAYDCSTFAGDEIWIVSYGMISAGSDDRMRSINLLQLFDSRALSIRDEPYLIQNFDPAYDEQGTPTFLYAADPDYPTGYDTNQDGVLAYMNTVREEDLRYYTRLDELENAGYTCVGVLMELRGCDLLGGKYQYMGIPVKVNGDDKDLVGKTVATVNAVRVWSWDLGEDMTWAKGTWNGEKNVLENFPKPGEPVEQSGYIDELANGGKSPPNYIKTEYQDGLQVSGTHAGGTLAGNSLLILNYKAGINIGVDNKGNAGSISYNLGEGESVVDYRLKNIRTEISDLTGQTQNPTTKLTIRTVLDEGYTGESQRISVSGGSYRIKGYAVDGDGNADDEETNIAISGDDDNPTVLEFEGSDGQRHRIRIHAQLGANSQSVTFVIQDAPVGIQLPDITFQANFAAVTALENNDTLKAITYISGEGDNRAYDQAKGNTDNVTVGVVLLSGTNLTKAVDTRYIELNGSITYDVTYTNSGTDVIKKVYFYDLLPKKGDIRGSDYSGNVVLRRFQIPTLANATVYYSTMEYNELYNTVKVFGGTEENGKISGMSEEKVEEMLRDPAVFKPLAHVENGVFRYDAAFDGMTEEEKTERMSEITGLYAKVENMQKGQTVTLQFTLQTETNKANDWYKNIANSWIAGSGTLPLTSNKVETQAVSRSISGLVWHDKNLNGIRDDGEPLLNNVTATLFKKNDDGSYSPCDQDVTNAAISPVTTEADGAYSFDKLAEGDYIVAFSGDALAKYTGATTYQQGGGNQAKTNDGMAADASIPGIPKETYSYYIRYSRDSSSMKLHSIADMHSVTLNNGVEEYVNQDLGLITAVMELPETGGEGTALFTFLGLALMAGALLFRRRRRA